MIRTNPCDTELVKIQTIQLNLHSDSIEIQNTFTHLSENTMSNVATIFSTLQKQYRTGQVTKETVYYFSIGDDKYTLFARPDGCEVQNGKAVENADCVIKADPNLFSDMVLKGKKPGMLDITRGKIKFSDMTLVMKLQDLFGLKIA